MKQFKLLGLMLLIGTAIFTTSCDDDIINPPGSGNEDGPQVVLVDQIGYVSADTIVNPGDSFTVLLTATSDEAELNTFSVEQDGVALDPSRYTIDGSDPGSSLNLLFGDDRTEFTKEVTVTAHTDTSISTYSFVVVDDNLETGSASISINTDNSGTGGDMPPDVTVGGNASVNLTAGSLYSIIVSATPVNGTLASIAVYQDGALISDLSRLEFADNDFDANPYGFPSQFADGFVNQSLLIRVQNSGSATYSVDITDEFGNVTSFEKVVNVGPTGTPVTTLTGVLLNQAGPAGTGGLDLDNGNSVGSSSTDAEIRDNGIDGGPIATNWLQTISSVNGTTIRSLIPGQNGLLETFTFASVETVESITDLHNNNSSAYAGNVLLVGDYLTVQKAGGKTYLLEVTAINMTAADNNDSYTFSIKQ